MLCYMATGAVPVPAPCSRAHTYPALGASQGRQLPSIHAAEQRRKTSRTIYGIAFIFSTYTYRHLYIKVMTGHM